MSSAVVDRVVAAVALVVLAPLLLLIAVAVRVDSAGPSLHRARRVGAGGRTLIVLKFRTMVVDASAGASKVTASGDPRITRLGRVLRASKLDELPQLWNVARGEMRLVGWRPEDPSYIDADDAAQASLLEHPPGLTSPATIAHRYEERTLADAVAAGGDLDEAYRALARAKSAVDADYLRSRTGWSDLVVLARTARSVAAPSRPTPSDGVAELDRVYRTYDETYARRWSDERPGNVLIAEEREDVARRLLGAHDLGRGRVLDIGAGAGGGFPNLFPRAHRIRLDLLLWRLRSGGRDGDVAVGADGRALPHPDGCVDVVLLSVVLSSLSAADGRTLLAEVERVLRPGGVVVVYDARVPNPGNRALRRVSRRSVVAALPRSRTRAQSVTVVPALARRLDAQAERWYRRLGRLRVTRTHNVIVGWRCAS